MEQKRTLKNFLRRNAAYIVLALCVLAIGLSITLVTINREAALKLEDDSRTPIQTDTHEPADVEPVDTEPTVDPTDEPQTPVSTVISFIIPVDGTTGIEEYSDTLKYNPTLKRYEAHKATDFFAEEGAPVYAVYDGVIKSVETTLLTGTTVIIDHGDGLCTVYNSLADGECVFEGQTVKQGAKIGEVSVTNRQEAAEGAHLHFQVTENGNIINPDKYLAIGEK